MGFNLLLLAGTSAFGLGSLLERAGNIRSGFFECYELPVEMVGSSPRGTVWILHGSAGEVEAGPR